MATLTEEKVARQRAAQCGTGPVVTARFAERVGRHPDDVSLRWRSLNGWAELTWREYADRACAVAAGLQSLGVARGEHVVLMLESRPEFHVADLGVLLTGAVPVSLYNTSPPARLRYFAGHSRAVAAILDGPAYHERLNEVRSELPDLRHLVVVDEPPAGAVPFSELTDADPLDLEAAVSTTRPEDVATLIYTSGTTGPPKGAEITHRNVAAVVDALVAALGYGVAGYRMVSALPMAHIAERVASHYVHLAEGTCVTTCPDPTLLPEYLCAVQPQLFFGVPRLWEKAYTLVQALASSDPDGRGRFDDALAVGEAVAERSHAGLEIDGEWAHKLSVAEEVLAPVRALMGLDKCEAAASTAAPISPDVIRFFVALGIPISEVYGLSEATGPVTWDPHRVVAGDVGRPLPSCEVRIAGNGEILVKGPTVFRGYLDDPVATAGALDAEGWLHTGDLGALEDGRLRIVGREKDLLVTAGGENVAPSVIESSLRGHPLVSEAFVAGDGRPYLVALLTVDDAAVQQFLADRGESWDDPALSGHELVRAELAQWVDAVNDNLSRVEQVKRFAVLDHDWGADSDELTPTMKVRRQAVLDKFSGEIARLYL